MAQFEMPMRSCVALCLLIMMSVLLGCTSQPAAEVPDVASGEPAEKPVTAETRDDSQVRAVPQANPPVATPLPVDEVAETPSDAESTQASESPATPAVTPEPQQDSPDDVALKEGDGREYRTVFYRADARQSASMPAVELSEGHRELCVVKVGDTMPNIELEQLGGGRCRLAELAGKSATVVVFWKSDRRMAQQQLADIRRDVLETYGDAGVAVVGIAVEESLADAQAALERAGASLPTLLDADGKAFAQVGSEKLPRTYLLDPQSKILWFDIEYSLSTRRELHQALRSVTGQKQAD